MIIEDKGILFIHIPKTAGDSIEYLLEEKYKTIRMGRHQPLSFFLKEGYQPKIIFTVVRNPFDRLVSIYHFCNIRVSFLQFLKNIHGVIHGQMEPRRKLLKPVNPINKHNSLIVYDFKGCRINWNMVAPFSYWVPLDRINEVTILRFEQISEEWEKFKHKINIEEPLPHRNHNPKKKKPFPSFYGQREIELVRQIYGWELDYFGYSL